MEKTPEKIIPQYLQDIELWKIKIEEVINKRNLNTLNLLNNGDDKKIEKELLFQDIPQNEKHLYAETASRIIHGLYKSFPHEQVEGVFYEIRRLMDKINSELNDEVFLHILTTHIARERNSNTTAGYESFFPRIMENVAETDLKDSRNDVYESIINPFELKDGDEIFRLDDKAENIESFKIEILTDGIKGVVAYEYHGKKQEDLDEFNHKLSRGTYMKQDGSNCLGGIEYIKAQTKIDKIFVGSVIKISETGHLMENEIITECTIVKTNKSELEEKYGDTYIGFINKIPRNKPFVLISIKIPDGSVVDDIDIRDLKIVD